MSAVEILPTGSEPLRRQLTTAGVGLTGATVRCDVRRSADGLVLDFADSTFKAIGVVGTRYRSLTAVDAVEWPGLYQGTALDLSAIVGGVAVGAVLTVTYYTTAPSALTLDQDELRVVAAGATAADVTAGTAAVLAGIITDHGAGSYATATGFAVPGSAMTLAADAITSATIAAGAIGASEAPLLANLDAAVSTRASAANLTTAQTDITTILTRVDVASSTLATAANLALVATDTTKTRRALYNRRSLSSLGLFSLYADDAVTVLYTATVTDVTGSAITVAAGDAARTTALV